MGHTTGCGCRFAETQKWHCCEAINDANIRKREEAEHKAARTAATAARRKASQEARKQERARVKMLSATAAPFGGKAVRRKSRRKGPRVIWVK